MTAIATAGSGSTAPATDRARIVVAPDKFKGSLTAGQVAEIIAARLREAHPQADVLTAPIADGGEGTVDVALGQGYAAVTATVRGPLGASVLARYALRGDSAVVEMAAAAGLALVPGSPTPQTAAQASTFGVGELILDALDRGAQNITLGVGGSATTDGGAGMLAALGAVIEQTNGPGGLGLATARRVALDGLDRRLATTRIVIATDVDNPLTGPHGASAVYAPQKGADPATVAALDAALGQWADLVAEAIGRDEREATGAGAAGGTAFAALTVLGGEIRSGIDVVAELSGLDEAIREADVVIVGEGSLDAQSLRGKGPIGVAKLGAQHGAQVLAVVGRNLLDADQTRAVGIERVFALTDREPPPEACMRDAARLLDDLAQEVATVVDPDRAAHQAQIVPLTADEYREAMLSTVPEPSAP